MRLKKESTIEIELRFEREAHAATKAELAEKVEQLTECQRLAKVNAAEGRDLLEERDELRKGLAATGEACAKAINRKLDLEAELATCKKSLQVEQVKLLHAVERIHILGFDLKSAQGDLARQKVIYRREWRIIPRDAEPLFDVLDNLGDLWGTGETEVAALDAAFARYPLEGE
jgi:chromosome segregation ATPase